MNEIGLGAVQLTHSILNLPAIDRSLHFTYHQRFLGGIASRVHETVPVVSLSSDSVHLEVYMDGIIKAGAPKQFKFHALASPPASDAPTKKVAALDQCRQLVRPAAKEIRDGHRVILRIGTPTRPGAPTPRRLCAVAE